MMREIYYCASDVSALGSMRCAQIRAVSRILSARAVIWVPDSEMAALAGRALPDVRIDILPEWRAAEKNPAQAAEILCRMIASSAVAAVAVIMPQTPHGMRVMSILSASLGVPCIHGWMTCDLGACRRSICANRVVETLDMPQTPFCATLAQEMGSDMSADRWPVDGDLCNFAGSASVAVPTQLSFEAFERSLVGLDSARVVFAGGRGLGSSEQFKKLGECAKKYGGALAASRLAVDLGWCRNDLQVGQTGRCIAPEIYVAFGISGAIQHLSGMKQSGTIIAVNTDPGAPIFEHADFGLNEDAGSVIDYLLSR